MSAPSPLSRSDSHGAVVILRRTSAGPALRQLVEYARTLELESNNAAGVTPPYELPYTFRDARNALFSVGLFPPRYVEHATTDTGVTALLRSSVTHVPPSRRIEQLNITMRRRCSHLER